MGEHSVCFRLREPAEVRLARDGACKMLFGWGLSEYAEAIALIVSELVTNALRHGEGQVRLGISRDSSHLHVEVHDDGPGHPVRRPVTMDDESGHGLELVDALLMEHDGTRGVQEDDAGHGKTVHVSIRLADAQ